jgi:uncharacterized damage-inducible protein DinB
MNRRPTSDEYADYYGNYIRQVPGDDVLAVLVQNKDEMVHFLENIGWEKWEHAYAPGKWTMAEVLGHIIDGERIFAYRALRIARNDATPLPGFEQDDYVKFSGANRRLPASLVQEYKAVREATIQLFINFTDEMWERRGTASDFPVTPLALAYIIAGHELHHRKIMQERYL